MISFVVGIVLLLVSDVVRTAMVALIIVGATSNKLLNVIDNLCNSAYNKVSLVIILIVNSYLYYNSLFF